MGGVWPGVVVEGTELVVGECCPCGSGGEGRVSVDDVRLSSRCSSLGTTEVLRLLNLGTCIVPRTIEMSYSEGLTGGLLMLNFTTELLEGSTSLGSVYLYKKKVIKIRHNESYEITDSFQKSD